MKPWSNYFIGDTDRNNNDFQHLSIWTDHSSRLSQHPTDTQTQTHKQLTKSRNAATNVDVYPGLVYVYTLSPHSALLTVVVVVTVNVTSQLKWF